MNAFVARRPNKGEDSNKERSTKEGFGVVRYSIIVPVLGPRGPFEDSVVSVLETRPANSEVLIPCPEDYEDPYHLDDEVQFIRSAESNIAALLNQALRVAHGELTAVLLPGATFEPSAEVAWDELVCASFAQREITAVVPRIVRSNGIRTRQAAGVLISRDGQRRVINHREIDSVHRLGPGASYGPTRWAGFFRTSALRSVGGWNPQIDPAILDVELASRLAGETDYLGELRLRVAPPAALLKTSEFGTQRDLRRVARSCGYQTSALAAARRAVAQLPNLSRSFQALAGYYAGRNGQIESPEEIPASWASLRQAA